MAPISAHTASQTSILSLPEELLERVLDECITGLIESKSSPSVYASSPFPSPSNSPANSKVGSPCPSPTSSRYATPDDTPAASPTRSRPASPIFPSTIPAACQPPTVLHTFPASETSYCRSSMTPNTSYPNNSLGGNGLLFPLLVSRLFHRISEPLVYRFITLSSRSQTRRLLDDSLRYYPERARWIRRLVIAGVWREAGEVLQMIAAVNSPRSSAAIPSWSKGKNRVAPQEDGWSIVGLRTLEITIDTAPPNLSSSFLGNPPPTFRRSNGSAPGNAGRNSPAAGGAQDTDADEFCAGLVALTGSADGLPLKHLVVRKPQNVYLTHQRAKTVIDTLAKVVRATSGNLETAHIAFRLSDDPVPLGSRRSSTSQASPTPISIPPLSGNTSPSTEPPAPPPGPIASFTQALADCPSLHTVVTHLPSVWNHALLRLSGNDSLERIVLLGSGGMPVSVCGDRKDRCGSSSGVSQAQQPSAVPRLPIHHSQHQPQLPLATQPRATLPSHPVERVYAASARGVDGYAAGVVRPGSGFPSPRAPTSLPPPPSGLFVNEARKHERLCALIQAGSCAGDGEGSGVDRKVGRMGMGSSDGCARPGNVSQFDALARASSSSLNSGVPLIAIPSPTKGRAAPSATGLGGVSSVRPGQQVGRGLGLSPSS